MCTAADIKQSVQSNLEYLCVVFGMTILLFDKDFHIHKKNISLLLMNWPIGHKPRGPKGHGAPRPVLIHNKPLLVI